MVCNKYIAKIKKYINDDIYIVFFMDRSRCFYSRSAINLLKDRGLSYKGYEIDRKNDKLPELLECLRNNEDDIEFNEYHRTLPIIYHKGIFIGGFTDLQKRLDN